MKNLKLIAFVFFAIISCTKINAQIIDVQTENKKKATINSSEKKIEKITHKGISYYIMDGIWYYKSGNKYVLKHAPKGAKLNFLPKGGGMVTMGGKKYYKFNGVFYKKLKDSLFEVVRP